MISIVQLGTVDYGMALKLQQKLIDLRKENKIGDTLLLLEHTPVITLGRNAKEQNIVATRDVLAKKCVEVFECDRGGDVTFHGPGQLVGYPIFDLRALTPKLGAVDYVRKLEEVLIRTCIDFGIFAERVPKLTGVWTKPDSNQQQAKLAAIGVHISRGVTSHGFALNVSTDLDYFKLIIPCGIATKPITSMSKETGAPVALQDVVESVVRNFGRAFNSQVLWVDTLDALLGHKVGVPLQVPAEIKALRGDDDTTWA